MMTDLSPNYTKDSGIYIETMGIQEQAPTVQEKFLQSIKLQEGRYEVKLPWKTTHRPLPSNLQLCKKRLQSLMKKLQTNPTLLKQYDDVIKDQLKKGIVEPAPIDVSDPDKLHYLPHHPVIREDKTTTKVRVVYDASAHTADQPALNDCLYTGPKFQQSIMDILLRFRTHPVGMAADIEKAFLMIAVAKEDRDALRFLWLDNISADQPTITPLRFTRVVFGVSSSPFLLNATIHHHISQYQQQDPEFVQSLLSALYVDDVTFGARDDHRAYVYQLYTKAKTRLAEGSFNLRKFVTNSSSLQQQIDSSEAEIQTTPTSPGDDQTYAKASLGVKGEKCEREEGKRPRSWG